MGGTQGWRASSRQARTLRYPACTEEERGGGVYDRARRARAPHEEGGDSTNKRTCDHESGPGECFQDRAIEMSLLFVVVVHGVQNVLIVFGNAPDGASNHVARRKGRDFHACSCITVTP